MALRSCSVVRAARITPALCDATIQTVMLGPCLWQARHIFLNVVKQFCNVC